MTVTDLGRWAEPSLLVLTSLAGGPKHGYAITQDVAAEAGIELGPGTLYGVLSRLERAGLIEALAPEQRRRPYRITGAGASVLQDEMTRMRRVCDLGLRRLSAKARPA